ncbi:MAG TPA: ATP-binding protein [Candidatus Thermoplasmatota archaeon]|nr:ATP-binding protein [Candidatus Thermoplasmatota archaeon]
MSRLHATIIACGAAATLLALASLAGAPQLALLAQAPVELGPMLWPAATAFTLLLFVLQQQGFVFHWRQQSTKISLDEVGIFVGLVAFAPAVVAVATTAASLLNQLVHRRAAGKAAFNVGQYAVAALATASACAGLLALGVPLPWAALPAPAIFYALTALQVSLLFAGIERIPVLRVFSQRFGRFVLIGASLGTSLGLVVLALHALHPLAVVAAIPLFAYLRRFGRLSEWADDEITTHRLVASVSSEVAGRADLDRVAERILSTCHELVDCGEASLLLEQGQGREPRHWRADFGPAEGFGGVAAEIRASDGARLGTLSVFPKPGQAKYGEREQQLLRTVGAAAAAAAANAEALRAAEAANRELGESEARYRSLFDSAHMLIHVLDADGRVLEANPAAQQTLGHDEAHVRGRPFGELLASADAATLVQRLQADDEVFGLETRLRRADGRQVAALVDARALPGHPRRFVVFARDISAMKTLEDELRRAMAQQHETIKRLENMNRELEQFTLWTTHDMREPLRSIGTIAGLLHDDLGAGTVDVEEAQDMAKRICAGADRLKERVKALHAFSLIVQRDDEFQDVDMQRVLEQVVTELETKIREKGATVVFPRERFPLVRAQPHRIDQVFANLIENALKYGRERDAMVELGFSETESEWRFYVRDDGPGIPAGYQERVFQLFQRGPRPTAESGSGAGLAIVKRIAEQHGGRAWVESQEGQGACFFLTLPKPAPVLLVSKTF